MGYLDVEDQGHDVQASQQGWGRIQLLGLVGGQQLVDVVHAHMGARP